jgi:hypothetical protein
MSKYFSLCLLYVWVYTSASGRWQKAGKWFWCMTPTYCTYPYNIHSSGFSLGWILSGYILNRIHTLKQCGPSSELKRMKLRYGSTPIINVSKLNRICPRTKNLWKLLYACKKHDVAINLSQFLHRKKNQKTELFSFMLWLTLVSQLLIFTSLSISWPSTLIAPLDTAMVIWFYTQYDSE